MSQGKRQASYAERYTAGEDDASGFHSRQQRLGGWLEAEAVKFLIDNGADINARNLARQNALTLAVTSYYSRRYPKTVRVLAKAGVDVNAMYDDGSTSLMLAADHCGRGRENPGGEDSSCGGREAGLCGERYTRNIVK